MMCWTCGERPATSFAVGLTDPPKVLGAVCAQCQAEAVQRARRERYAQQLPAALNPNEEPKP